MLILIVASGPDRGRVYELMEGNAVVLGREGDQVKLSDRKASREHAVLWSEQGQWFIQDKQSRHGTYRNQTRLTGPCEVNSGDRIQVGETLLVMARIHDTGSIDTEGPGVAAAVDEHTADVPTPLPMGRRRTSPWVVAAATVAALAFLAMNIAMIVTSRQDTRQITQATQKAAQNAVESSMPRLLAALDRETPAIADPAAATATDGLLRDVLARIDQSRQAEAHLATAQGQQALRDEVRQLVAALDARATPDAAQTRLAALLPRLEAAMDRLDTTGESGGETIAAVQTLATKLDEMAAAQPSSRQLAEAMQAAVKGAPTADVSGMEATLAKVLERIENAPAAPDTQAIMAALAEADLPQLQPSQELTQRAVAAIEGQAALRDQMAKLEAAVRDASTSQVSEADQTQALAAVTGRFDALEEKLVQEDAKLVAAMDALRQASAERGDATVDLSGLEAKLATLLDRPALTQEQVAAAVEDGRDEALARSLASVDEAVRKLADREPVKPVDPEALASAVRASVAELLAQQPTDEADAALTQKLDAALAKLDRAASSDDMTAQREAFAAALGEVKTQLAEAVAARPTAEPAATVDLTSVQESLAALHEQIEAMASSDTPDGLLKEAKEALAARKKADAKLAELAILMEAEPKRQEAMLQRVLAAIEAQEQSDAAGEGAMQRTLERLRAETASQMAALREAVQASGSTGAVASRGSAAGLPARGLPWAGRGERSGVDPATWDRGGQPTMSTSEWAQGALAVNGGEGVVSPKAGEGGGWNWGEPMATPASESAPPQTPRPDPLQDQYRRAWESGQTIRVGGSVDAVTGEVSEGRVLDPAKARAANFATWQDWYEADTYRERRWLETKAREWREKNPASEPLFDLPAARGEAG